MNKEEKEAVIAEYTNYWALVGKVRDVAVDALDTLSISDVISVLDRVKIELIQQETILLMDEEMQSGLEEEVRNESINPTVIKNTGQDTKAETLLENIKNMEEGSKELKKRISS